MTNLVQENTVKAFAQSGHSTQGFLALTSSCGVLEVTGRAKAKLGGKDRVRWLNGMMTNNIRDLSAGHGVYGFLLNPQGRIQGDLYAYNHPDFITVDADRVQFENILAIFRRYIIMDKVELEDITGTLTVLQITGPNAIHVLTTAGFQVPDLEPLQFSELSWNGSSCTVVRGEIPILPSYEIWCSPAIKESICEALINSGAVTVDSGAMELLRVAAGIPRFGQDIRDRDLPQETGQLRALNFAKGCYIGQEIVERIRSRGNVHRTFTGFLIEGSLPAPGTAIEAEGKSIGEITSVASPPYQAGVQNIALGYIRREFATLGNKISIAEAHAIVASLPFTNLLQQ